MAFRRGIGLNTLRGISSSSTSEASGSGCGSRWTGCFSETVVDGLRSCRGEGDRLICADWISEAISDVALSTMAVLSIGSPVMQMALDKRCQYDVGCGYRW